MHDPIIHNKMICKKNATANKQTIYTPAEFKFWCRSLEVSYN